MIPEGLLGVPGSAQRAPVKVLLATLDRIPTEALVTAEWVLVAKEVTTAQLVATERVLTEELIAAEAVLVNIEGLSTEAQFVTEGVPVSTEAQE